MLTARYEDDWDDGHYVVVLAVDNDYVYFQDPFIRMSKAFMPRKTFEDHWHQVMGGDLERNPKLIHLGIIVRGQRLAKAIVERKPDFSALDFSKFGSLNLIVTEFDRYLLPFDFLDALQGIWQDGNVRPNAFVFLRAGRRWKPLRHGGKSPRGGGRYRGDECSNRRNHRTQSRHSRTGQLQRALCNQERDGG